MDRIEIFWKGVRELEASLSEDPFVTSIEHTLDGRRGGVVVQVSRYLGAKMIFEGTHRLSTPEEITQAHQRANERRRAGEAQENLRRGTIVTRLGKSK